jgi:uncharacterized protein YycO
MKKIILIVFIALIVFGLVVYAFLKIYDYRSTRKQESLHYAFSKDELAKFRSGDIILRHGYGFVSDMIVTQLKEKYDLSHCAIVCRDKDSLYVIHSVSSSLSNVDGVQAQEIHSFIRESQYNSVVVVRYKTDSGKDQSCICEKAQDYLKKGIPFDNAFNINDSTEFYCTELLWKAILNEYHVDILAGKNNERKDHLRFDTFLDTAHFEIIIDHQARKQR